MADLIAFLNARLDEDEALANQAVPWPWGSDPATAWIGIPGPDPLHVWAHMTAHNPCRVLREVAAKRRIIAATLAYEAKIDGEWACCHSAADIAAGRCPEISPDSIGILRDIAAVYSDHPDYRQEWAR